MTVSKAKKILSNNGIIWNNYFELDHIRRNMTVEGNETIYNAIKRVQYFITMGK